MSERRRSDEDEGDRRVLTVRVASPDTAFDDLEERFRALDDADRPEPLFEVVLPNEAALNRLLRPQNVELLRTVSRAGPESIRETARLVDRDVRQVHDDLHALAQLNVLRFEDHGNAKQPVVWYDDLEVDLPIRDPSTAPA